MYTPPDANRVLKAAWVISSTDRAAGTSAYCTAKVGIAYGTEVDYYGTFAGNTTDVKAKAPVRFTGPVDMAQRVAKDRVVIVEATSAGTASLFGLSVQVLIGHTLVMPANRLQDREVQAAVDGTTDFLRNVGGGDQIITVPLWATGSESYNSYDSNAQTLTAGAGLTNGTASITIIVPSGETRDVLVIGQGAVVGSGGASVFVATLYDGTTSYDTKTIHAPTTTSFVQFVVTYAVRLTATTTFNLRMSATTNNAAVQPQTLSATAHR